MSQRNFSFQRLGISVCHTFIPPTPNVHIYKKFTFQINVLNQTKKSMLQFILLSLIGSHMQLNKKQNKKK